MIKKFFKKTFSALKKVFKPIGKALKRGLKGVGKFFGKLGPVGTLALSLMLPGIGSVFSSLGAWAGVGAGATAPFAGTVFGPLGKVIQGVARVGSKMGKVYNNVSSYVGDTINTITGGATGKFSNWVSSKLDNTRRMFGLETSMDAKGFETAINDNAKAVQNLTDVNATYTPPKIADPIPSPSIESMPGAETSIKSSKLSDEELFAQAEQKSLLAEPVTPTTKTNLEMNPGRETVEVPVGFETVQNETLKPFANNKNPFQEYQLKTKTVFKDELTPDLLDKINTDDVNYFAKFENNKVTNTANFVETNYGKKVEGVWSPNQEYNELIKNPKKLEGQVLRQDIGSISKPAAVVGSMLAPEAEVTGGQSVQVAPLPTDTDVKDYTDSVGSAYQGLGYKGPNTLEGYAMQGAYGNTPFNFLSNYSQRILQPSMTTAMPTIV